MLEFVPIRLREETARSSCMILFYFGQLSQSHNLRMMQEGRTIANNYT
jgi:hypothetical protein